MRRNPITAAGVESESGAWLATRAAALLQILGTRLLIVTGMATNTCVEATVRDAYMRDVVIPREFVAGVRRDWHDAALAVWDHYLGVVVGSTRSSASSRRTRRRHERDRRGRRLAPRHESSSA